MLGLLWQVGPVGAQHPRAAARGAVRHGQTATPGVTVCRDIPYVVGGHARQKLDLYVPTDVEGPVPLIIWIHGGGWLQGSKAGGLAQRMGYTGSDYALASLDYRLSGDAIFPAQIEDCKAAVRWLRAHAADYNLDPDRFGAWGSSAGGHLAALLGTSGGVGGFDVGAYTGLSSRVQAVCDFFGPTDLAAFVTLPRYAQRATPDAPETRLLGGLVKDRLELAARANPIRYVSPDDPPFLIVHGDADGTVPHGLSRMLFEALKQVGVRVRFHTIRGGGHGRGFDGPEVDAMVRAFFDLHLTSRPMPCNLGQAEATASEASAP